MPTSTNVTNLKINELTEAQYDTAVQGGVIGENELSVITDMDIDAIQVSTMPTAGADELGNIYQFIGTTDANYTNGYFYKCVSDGQNPATYSWTQTDVQPQAGGLPSQTGQSGKFLTTDGTDASWATISALQNTATSPTSLTILGNVSTVGQDNLNIGQSSTVEGPRATAIGVSARSWYPDATALGYIARADKERAIAIGAGANVSVSGTGTYGIAIGYSATVTADSAIQIGGNGRTNSESGTLCIGSGNNNYKLLDSDGTIPADRMKNAINKYSTMPTAASTNEGWIVQYTGATDATYTHGYIYECVSDGGNPATYSWSAVSVQAGGGSSLPSQTGNIGKFLTTDGTNASWGEALKRVGSQSKDIGILATAVAGSFNPGGTAIGIGAESESYGGSSVAMGYQAVAGTSSYNSYSCVALGPRCKATGSRGIAIGYNAQATAACAMQIGPGTNSTANTCQLGYYNGSSFTTYQLLDFTTGTIPAARHATLPAADGTYVLKLVIASGVPTLSWVAE